MKDSGVEWTNKIPANWEIKSLKKQFSFGKGLPITKEDLVENGVPVISYGQIHSKSNNGVSISNDLIRFVGNEYIVSNPQSLLKKGNFILADTSEDLDGCGNAVYIDKDMTVFAGYHSIILRSKEACYEKYFAYLFLTNSWRNQIRSRVSGIKVFSITQGILKKINILYPPFSEQKKIADYLDEKCGAIDEIIAKTEQSIEEYKKLKQAAITEAVTKGIRPNRKMKDSGIEWIGEIPEDWDINKIKRFLRYISTKDKGNCEVLSLYRELGIVPKNSRNDNHNVTAEDTSNYRFVRKGDFVINKMKAWQGSVAVSDFEGIVSPAYFVYEFTSNVFIKKYFHYLLRNKQYAKEFERLSGGIRIGQWDLPATEFENTMCLVPPLSEQQEIADYLDEKCSEIDVLIEKKQQFLTEMATYKKSLIYEYVTGKKEVV